MAFVRETITIVVGPCDPRTTVTVRVGTWILVGGAVSVVVGTGRAVLVDGSVLIVIRCGSVIDDAVTVVVDSGNSCLAVIVCIVWDVLVNSAVFVVVGIRKAVTVPVLADRAGLSNLQCSHSHSAPATACRWP